MEEVEMYDAFQPPPPSQSTLDWLAAGSMHELVPRMDVVQWQPSEIPCPALNNLRREMMVVDQSVTALSTANHLFTTSSFPSISSISQTTFSSTTSSAVSSASRRGSEKYTLGRRKQVKRSATELTSSMKEAIPALGNMLQAVSVKMDESAKLKQHHIEKKREQASKQVRVRPLVRTHSAQPARPPKRQTLSRHVSEEVLGTGSVASGSRGQDRLADTEWVSSLLQATVRTKESVVDEVAHEVPLPLEMPTDAALAVRENRLKTHKTSKDSASMPPPPPPLHNRPKQPKKAAIARDPPPPTSVGVEQPRAQQPPMASQSASRALPALGMRRANPYVASQTAQLQSSQSLPSKQRGFKPPFARPPAAGSQTSSTSTSSTSASRALSSAKDDSSNTYPSPSPPSRAFSRPRSPSPSPEADSSYGEISFDMDLVEEAMKPYDVTA
ncbi:hypothetical protein BC835DRAFT_1414176 [Cytidiella melzeri]|nr:hypothetical protein BC835DRAFT_1414176 [Cytidiella melzeri]